VGKEATAPSLELGQNLPEQNPGFEIKEPDTPEEWAAAFALRKKYLNYPEYGNDASEDDKDHSDGTRLVIALDQDGEVIGTGRINYAPGEEAAEISRVAVESEDQKNGIGRSIVEVLESSVVSQGATAAELITTVRTNAKDFYTKLGYKELERKIISFGNGKIEVVRMHKDLGEG
jgi:ribosomal protein S18 acetylase RimI-like enzyme